MSRFRKAGLILGALALGAFASSVPWTKDPMQWTAEDAERILNASPWAQLASVKFENPSEEEMQLSNAETAASTPPPANMSGPNGGTDGKWDGGVGRLPSRGTPTLSVTLLWESAKPVAEALSKSGQGAAQVSAQNSNDYVISISGLIPAARKPRNESAEDAHQASQESEVMLENVMNSSRLYPRGRKGITPDDAKLDTSTGTLRLYFPRSQVITLKDKEVVFVTRYGAMSVRGVFRLKEMCLQGQLEL